MRPVSAGKVQILSDTTVKKVRSVCSPKGELGQKHLVSGKWVSMRLWADEQPGEEKARQPTGLRDGGSAVGRSWSSRARRFVWSPATLVGTGPRARRPTTGLIL
jgi:hypothetical protein